MLFRREVTTQINVILPPYDDDCIPFGEGFCVRVQLTGHVGKPPFRFKHTHGSKIGWEFLTEQGGDLSPMAIC